MRKNFPFLQRTLVLGLGLAVSGCDTISGAADSVSNTVSSVGDAVGNIASDLNPFSDSAPSQTADNEPRRPVPPNRRGGHAGPRQSPVPAHHLHTGPAAGRRPVAGCRRRPGPL